MTKDKMLFRCLRYKIPQDGKETRNVWPVINSVQWSILYSHQNDDVLHELATTALKAKRLKFQKIKLDTIFKTSYSTLMETGQGSIFGGIFIN